MLSVQMLIYFGHVKICRIFSATLETPTNELSPIHTTLLCHLNEMIYNGHE